MSSVSQCLDGLRAAKFVAADRVRRKQIRDDKNPHFRPLLLEHLLVAGEDTRSDGPQAVSVLD